MSVINLDRAETQAPGRNTAEPVRPTHHLLAFQRMKRAIRSAFFAEHPAECDYAKLHAELLRLSEQSGETSFDGKCLARAAEVTLDYARDQNAHIRDWWASRQTKEGGS